MRTLYGIQYLRAVAAIAVVLFHAAEKTGGTFAIGAAGVDVFFVISGFIMWVISEGKNVSPGRFLADRVARIVPVYWIATAVMIFGALAGLFPNLTLSAAHVLASLFFIPAPSPSSGEIWPVLVQGWTLNFEMFFYVAFALALFLPRSRQLPVLGGVFAILAVAGTWLETDDPLLSFYTQPIILEFVAGMLLGQMWLKGRMPRPGTGIALVVLAVVGFAAIELFRLPFDERSCGPLAVALVLGVLALEAHGFFRQLAVPAFLGDASYSIYLWHTFAISVVAKVALRLALDPLIATLLACFAGVAVGLAAYLMIERPVLAARRSVVANRRLASNGQTG
ncbi:acyltransferase [Rhizobium sp. ARZ01]|uniref:acyltransferase family protein n=1 Tax=Rhizobium sp. ARZ01 TaxID=2769313 RepID=UPI00177C99DC|nr:acyltransferase [Rhizobium sp. ARZ01]MBD9375310.1 acyltransferase [Rhizobium sp. ARZ01]